MEITRDYLRKLVWDQLSENSKSDDLFNDGLVEVIGEEILNINENLEDQFEVVNEETVLKEAEQKIEEIKSIKEEIKRMRQLVDFRSPLLNKDNS